MHRQVDRAVADLTVALDCPVIRVLGMYFSPQPAVLPLTFLLAEYTKAAM